MKRMVSYTVTVCQLLRAVLPAVRAPRGPIARQFLGNIALLFVIVASDSSISV
jgi:hypothetical protein